MRNATITRPRPGSEEGIALFMALAMMFVLSIVLVSVISFSTSSAQHASRNQSGQTAYALGEAGLNNALAQIASHYYDVSNVPNNTTTTGDATWSTSGSQQSPSNTAACTSSSPCVTWTAAWAPNTSGLGIVKGTWTITSTGRVRNPTGPAAAQVTRVVKGKVDVTAPPEKVATPIYWQIVYSGQGPTLDCDMTLGQGVSFKNPVYVQGNLCLGQNGAVVAPSTLKVGGWFDRGQNGYLGTSGSPLPDLTIAGSCDGGRTMTPCGLNQKKVGGQWLWTNETNKKSGTIWATTFSNGLQRLSDPSIDFAGQYKQSYPGACTTSPTQTPQLALDGVTRANAYAADGDGGTFNLTPAYSYTCTTPSGSLAWNASTQRLTVSGNVYIDANLTTSSNTAVIYSGSAALYVTGTVTFANNSKLCATAIDPSGKGCLDPWDANSTMLLIVAKGDIGAQNLRGYQGGLYSATKIDVGGGQTNVEGPLVTPGQLVPGQQAGSAFTVNVVISGAPGTPPPHYVLSSPYSYQ